MDKLGRTFAALPVALGAIVSLTAANVEWTPTATVYVIGGAGWETVDEPVMRAMLDHRYDTQDNTFVNIEWPAYLGTLDNSVAEASDDLYALIMEDDGEMIAVGASGSTFVMNEVMRRLAEDPNPDKPQPEDISFVIIGDGERGLVPALVPLIGVNIPLISYQAKPIPVTPYDAIVVKGEYDGLADWPDRPWNLLAVANAWLGSPGVEGFGEIHWDSIFANLDAVPDKNVTIEVNSAGGTTTTYLVPTAELPLLYPLHAMGVPQAAINVLNSVLKPIVDAGYSRNDPAWLKEFTQVLSLPSISLPSISLPAATVPKRASSTAAQVAAPVTLATPAVADLPVAVNAPVAVKAPVAVNAPVAVKAPVAVNAPVAVDAPAVRTPKRATVRDQRGDSAAKVAAAAAEQVSDAKPAQSGRAAKARAAAAR